MASLPLFTSAKRTVSTCGSFTPCAQRAPARHERLHCPMIACGVKALGGGSRGETDHLVLSLAKWHELSARVVAEHCRAGARVFGERRDGGGNLLRRSQRGSRALCRG